MKISISDTTIGKSSNLQNYVKESKRFLVENESSIIMNDRDQRSILNSQNTLMKTVISELYQQAIAEEKLDMFTLLDLTKVSNIPSWFLITWLDIDILSIKDTDSSSYKVMSSIPSYRDKILVDVTPHLSKQTRGIKDITGFQAKIIRDLLCRSYLLSDTLWLSPTLVYLLAKIYVTVLANKLGRLYNLTVIETYQLATILAVFFTNKCATIDDVINPVMHKMDFLSRSVEVKEIYKYIESKYDVKTFDLVAVIDTMKHFGPSRMGKMNLATFFDMNTNLGPSQIESLISLEYVPYFCHIILQAVSGSKSSMYHQMKKLNLSKEANQLGSEILRTNSFIQRLF